MTAPHCRLGLVGSGLLVVVALFAQFGSQLGLGQYILWYIQLGLAYGQFSVLRVLLALASLAIAIRLLVHTSPIRLSLT